MTAETQPGKFNHIEWVDLHNNNTMIEVAVMNRDAMGNLYFIRVDTLDNVDKGRLVKIVTNRNSGAFPLWDVMAQITLNNGTNALDYFHQLVRVRTPGAQILMPKLGQVGVREAPQVPPVAEQVVATDTAEVVTEDATVTKKVVKKKAVKKNSPAE